MSNFQRKAQRKIASKELKKFKKTNGVGNALSLSSWIKLSGHASKKAGEINAAQKEHVHSDDCLHGEHAGEGATEGELSSFLN